MQNEDLTNIAIGFKRSGYNQEVFHLLIMVTKKIASAAAMANSMSEREGKARILVGMVFEPNWAPYLVILNRGKNSELKLGPSNIKYDVNS